MAAKHARVEVYNENSPAELIKDWDGKVATYAVAPTRWRWRFISTNGANTGNGSEAYNRRRWCLHGAAVTLGFKPEQVEHLKPGQEKVVRRAGGSVRVVVLDG